MAQYAKLFKKFWNNKKVRIFTDDEKLLFLYLISNPHVSIMGVYILPKSYIAEDINWEIERVSKGFTKLFEKGYISYDDTNRIILIKSWFEHNKIDNGNQLKKALAELSEIPYSPIIDEYAEVLKGLPEGLHKGLLKGLPNGYSNPVTVSVTESLTVKKRTKGEEIKSPVENFREKNDKIELDTDILKAVWNRCKERLQEIAYLPKEPSVYDLRKLKAFFRSMQEEAQNKDSPSAWFKDVCFDRMNENLEDLKVIDETNRESSFDE